MKGNRTKHEMAFGQILHIGRTRGERGLRETARWLGVSHAHLHDVERGSRQPSFTRDQLVMLAGMLGKDPQEVARLHGIARAKFELPVVDVDDHLQNEVGGLLQILWEGMDSVTLRKLRDVLVKS